MYSQLLYIALYAGNLQGITCVSRCLGWTVGADGTARCTVAQALNWSRAPYWGLSNNACSTYAFAASTFFSHLSQL